MPKIDLLPCPFCGGKAETLPLDKYDSYGNHEMLWYSECGECFARSGYYNTYGEATIAWNTRASGWISCSERMPEVGITILILFENQIKVSRLEKSKLGFLMNGEFIGKNLVTHWMHLPKPPKGDAE